MPLIELSFYTFLLYLLLTAMLLPPGFLIANRLTPKLTERGKILCSFAYSSLIYAAIVSALIPLGFTNAQIALVLISLVFVALVVYSLRHLRSLLNRENLFIHLYLYLYLLFTLTVSAFPTGSLYDIRIDNTMMLTGLPVDNLIPYNVSRHLVERIDFNAAEVVPDWKATDRGPLGAIISATVFILLDLKETALWLSSSPWLAFVYQAVISYLNLLSLLAVWLIAAEYFGRKSALFSILLLGAGYFYFLNVQFSWPKFYMAYFLMAAIYLWQHGRHYCLAGALSAAAMLSHDSAAFSIVILLAIIFLGTLIKNDSSKRTHFFRVANLKKALIPVFGFICCYLLIQAPWIAVKKLYAPPSPRLIYLHLFCYHGQSVEGLTMGSMLKQYLADNSLAEIAEVRFANLIYPFDPRPIFEQISTNWRTPFALAGKIGHLVFFQLINGLGLPIFGLFLASLVIAWRNKASGKISPYITVAYASLIVAALISACRNNTVNHVWAYLPFCVSVIPVGWLLSRGSLFVSAIAALGIGLNVILGVYYFFYQSQVRPFLHASNDYSFAALLLLILVLTLPMLGLLLLKDKEIGESSSARSSKT